MEEEMGYTFYGDLLGISGYYKLSPQTAYNKLDDFYKTTFRSLKDYCKNNSGGVKVNMFSDSLLIWGDNPQEIIKQLQGLYIKLIDKELLLRGAIVNKKLTFEPRITLVGDRDLNNFSKKLPQDDTLARAVGLEKSQKGSRLIIESSLAKKLLRDHKERVTREGYLQELKSNVAVDDILRRICPTPDNNSYELLYFWQMRGFTADNAIGNIPSVKDRLKELVAMYDSNIEIQKHYKETLELLERCKQRQQFTDP